MDIDNVVGMPYPEYIESKVFSGEGNARTLEKRQIQTLEIK